MGAVDDEDVDPLGDQALGPLEIEHADRRPHPQPPLRIFAGVGEALHHVDVFDRDQPGEMAPGIDEEELLHLVGHENLLGLVERDIPGGRDEPRRRHDVGDRRVAALEEAEIAAGDDPDELPPVGGDRHPGDVVLIHHVAGPGHRRRGGEGDGVEDDPVGAPLDLVDLLRLPLDGEILVDHPQAPLLGQRDRHLALGHRVHR